jgi:hypothetical protein
MGTLRLGRGAECTTLAKRCQDGCWVSAAGPTIGYPCSKTLMVRRLVALFDACADRFVFMRRRLRCSSAYRRLVSHLTQLRPELRRGWLRNKLMKRPRAASDVGNA